MNHDLEASRTYHIETKHSSRSIRSNPHHLDWKNQPLPFKVYKTLEPIPLPLPVSGSEYPALKAISALEAHVDDICVLDSSMLAQIFYYSAGITKQKQYPGREIQFRAASCTGALYHIDLYLICGDMPGLDAGVYQFGVHDFALRRLRRVSEGWLHDVAASDPIPAVVRRTNHLGSRRHLPPLTQRGTEQ